MELIYKATAKKQLKKLPLSEARKVFKKTQMLKEFPFVGKSLSGEYEGIRSVRAWPYRILYSITNRKIVIMAIKHRQRAYK